MPLLSAFARLQAVRPLLVLTLAGVLCTSTVHAAPSGLINDTGQTQCDNGSNVMVACTATTTGDAATPGTGGMPRQDGRFGRDVASPTKVGGGAAGFDFTPLDASGNTIALTGSPAVPVSTPRCVKDNVTNLIWEVKTSASPASGLQDSSYGYAWGNNAGFASCNSTVSPCNTDAYIAALNAANLCGETANDWRLPTARELLSIVHNGLTNYSTALVDVAYFPNTQANWYWTSDTYAPFPSNAWFVYFNNGGVYETDKNSPRYVRLVRDGQ